MQLETLDDALAALLDDALDVDESSTATVTVGRIEHDGAVAYLVHDAAGWIATCAGARTLHPDAPSAVQYLADHLLPPLAPPDVAARWVAKHGQ